MKLKFNLEPKRVIIFIGIQKPSNQSMDDWQIATRLHNLVLYSYNRK